MCTDKAIWICKRMIRWMWASARTRMQFENGYVNRFGCRLFAAYFLPNGFASLFCNSFRFLYSTCCYCWFTFFVRARQSFRSNRSESFFCMFTKLLYVCEKIEMQWHLLHFHISYSKQHSICDRHTHAMARCWCCVCKYHCSILFSFSYGDKHAPTEKMIECLGDACKLYDYQSYHNMRMRKRQQ